jgi:hypothetical protein
MTPAERLQWQGEKIFILVRYRAELRRPFRRA